MANLGSRLVRLEAKSALGADAPSLILLTDLGRDKEDIKGASLAGRTLTRAAGESAEAFSERASEWASEVSSAPVGLAAAIYRLPPEEVAR